MNFLLIAGFPDSLLQFRGDLIDALLARGQQVHVAAPGLCEGHPIAHVLLAKGVTVHDIPLERAGMNPLKDLRLAVHLWRLMRQVKPQRVLSYTVKPVIYGTLAAWLARVPQRCALITGLGYAFQGEGGRGAVRRLVQTLYRHALARAQVVFFQNPDDAQLFKTLGLVSDAQKVKVVNGSGVNLIAYPPCPVPTQPFRLLFIGRLLGDKGVREYVQAAQQVKMEYPETQFDLVGWIDENPNAVSQQELDLWIASGWINYLGRLNDVRPALNACTVYVLPSYREGTPRTVLEAMAVGRAIVSTDAPGCRETVVPGRNGFLVPPQQVAPLVQAITELVQQPQRCVEMGRESRLLVQEKYDVHTVNRSMLQEMGL